MPATKLSKTRFEALCYSRTPYVEMISDEHEWWANSEEKNLGIVLFEQPDQQWIWIILGRDERGVFRCVDMNHSIDTQDEASSELQRKLTDWESRPEEDSFQGDATSKKNEIFNPEVKENKLNPVFKAITADETYSSARGIIKELAFAFTDLDGNYIKDFQTAGFNGRLWELYLFAFLYEQRFTITDEFDRPDFWAVKGGFSIAIEATTVNPTNGLEAPAPKTIEDRIKFLNDYMPIKFGSALFSKLKKRYWELPHMQGAPLIIAIHDFHLDGSMTWTPTALREYLYALRERPETDQDGNTIAKTVPITEHVWGEKRIPSGFFNQPNAEHISAVLFSNAATLSKFNRIGKIAGFGSADVRMWRFGDLWNPDPKATLPIPFNVEVELGKYSETWSEGIRVFHNPNASNPIPPELFPLCSHHSVVDGRLLDFLPDHFVFNSKTLIMTPERSE
jgi:hypothetical protein